MQVLFTYLIRYKLLTIIRNHIWRISFKKDVHI